MLKLFVSSHIIKIGILSSATSVYNFFVNNWGWLAPIVAGITASVTAWKLAMAGQMSFRPWRLP